MAQAEHCGTKPQSRHCRKPARAAAVEEEDRLLALLQRLVEAELQRAAEDAAVAALELVAHIHHVDRRQRRRARDADDARACRASIGRTRSLQLEQLVTGPTAPAGS